jgi:hypothetical protein
VLLTRHSDDGVLDLFTQKRLGRRLHLLKNHGRYFLGREFLLLPVDDNLHHGLVVVANNIIGHQLLIGLDRLIAKVTPDQSLDVKDGVLGIDGGLILGGIAHETLSVLHEGDVGGGDTVTLVVGHDFDAAVFEDADAGVGCAEIDSDGGADFVFVVGEDGGGAHEGHCWSSGEMGGEKTRAVETLD